MQRKYTKPKYNGGWFKKGHKTSALAIKNSGLALKGKPRPDYVKRAISSANSGEGNGMFGKNGNKSSNWHGDKVSYRGLHNWVVNNKGKAKYCVDCGKIGEIINGRWDIGWSNIDHQYLRNLNDYVGRCRSCHAKYDIRMGFWTPSGKNK